MKQKKILAVILFSALFFTTSGLFGQDTDEAQGLKVFGLGLHIEQFKLNDLTSDISTAPSNRIILTITPVKNFRLEPEIGFNFLNDKENDLKSKSISLGIGGFGMYQKGKTNIYAGLRLEYGFITEEYIDYIEGETTGKSNKLAVGPAIGAEYFFSPHFSFGGEIGLKYMHLFSKDTQYSDLKESEEDYINTDTGLFVRFYF